MYSGGWQYDNNGGLYAFTPTGTDVLVAEVDLTADTVTDLEGQSGTQYNGIAYG